MVPAHDEDQVILLSALGEVLLGVVDDMVSAEGANHVYLRGAAHTGHLSAERFGDLDREQPDASRRPDEQDLLACLDAACVAKRLSAATAKWGWPPPARR